MAKRVTRTPANKTSAKPRVDRPAGKARGVRSNAVGSGPSEEDIRLRAYQRYLERGGGDGGACDDWLDAERELKGKR